MGIRVNSCFILIGLCLLSGCANITAPTGGKKDTRPPKLLSVVPENRQTNTHIKRIELQFDEYITVNDPVKEVQLSPILAISPTVTGLNKHVVVKIIDSLLEDNTTYRLTFGNAIKDLHEGNAFANYTYTFSTGSYFDSLQLSGSVKNAETGSSKMEGVTVELYYASDNDSAVVRHKPKYVTKTDASGIFTFKGLPGKTFKIYALKDVNDNLIYDGPVLGELVGFAGYTVTPGDSSMPPVHLSVFAEVVDTGSNSSKDSLSLRKEGFNGRRVKSIDEFSYVVELDTSNSEKKSFDITGPIKIKFPKLPEFNYDKIMLSYDSTGHDVLAAYNFTIDSPKKQLNLLNPHWKENTVYTLKLIKGFAKDTAGKDLMPSRYTFRTKEEEVDYGKIKVHLPGKYLGSKYIFKVLSETDTIYQQPVTDTNIVLRLLKPGKYTFRIIVDENGNGKWDTGNLLGKIQPEDVIPYPEEVNLKAGWENAIDFEQKQKIPLDSKDNSPKSR